MNVYTFLFIFVHLKFCGALFIKRNKQGDNIGVVNEKDCIFNRSQFTNRCFCQQSYSTFHMFKNKYGCYASQEIEKGKLLLC